MKSAFQCIALSSAHSGHPNLAIAAARAGGVGLLDTEFCAGVEAVSHSLRTLIDWVSPNTDARQIGIRVSAQELDQWSAVLSLLEGVPHHVVLFDWAHWNASASSTQVGKHRDVWLEILGIEDLAKAPDPEQFTGWVARGSECGGRCGRQSAFILTQKLAKTNRPFWVQGGIGISSSAACRAAGAAGVIFDDSLHLLNDSPSDAITRSLLKQIEGQETGILTKDDVSFRVATYRGFTAGFQAVHEGAEVQLGWGDPKIFAWPVGQGISLAKPLAERFTTLGRLFRAVQSSSAEALRTARTLSPLGPGSPLAESHGTEFPIVQGPMTRVSDRAEFAAEVAGAGALPFAALALMKGQQATPLLEQIKERLADKPWGVGILGFVPLELREEQLAAIQKVRPPFALIAGGRPDQIEPLEQMGIATYLHVPTPKLLRLYLNQGARRFVFEGNECGGHTGPLSSFALWDAMVQVLLKAPTDASSIHVLFAGGVHDGLSAAMVSALSAPLAQRGMKIGVLMGTAYLFTREAVASGAIVETFQKHALECQTTTTIESKTGHSIRCVPTEFINAFEKRREELVATNLPPSEIGDRLEALIAGKLRIASKGISRSGDKLVKVSENTQEKEGLYMMGELAGLCSSLVDCRGLHQRVSEGSCRELPDLPPVGDQEQHWRQKPVAIVGVGCLLPGSDTPEDFWQNLLAQKETFQDIPKERWDWRLYFDADRKAPDRIYAKTGGFIDPLRFDPLAFGIPPNSLSSISLTQLLTLETARRALNDAGYGDRISDPALRERTAVYLGAASNADLEQMYITRTTVPVLAGELPPDAAKRLPEWTEESHAGILKNVTAGRIANRMDFNGPNATLDAACASSLAAIDLAVRELDSMGSDLVLAGGVDFEQTPYAYMAFSKTQALSPTGQARVFDESADGIVISEGSVVFALKRLDDAERDGDRILAVIRGVAGASDGKGLGMTAPKSEGQQRAVAKAWRNAGMELSQMGLYEAHGTGTKVGDRTELETIRKALEAESNQERICAIGSAKSLIGHTRAAAGAVGLLKVAMALHHKVLPPHAGIESPLAGLREANSSVYHLNRPKQWEGEDKTRCAGVSAFGFGGTNFHAAVEEYRHSLHPTPLGGHQWPCELFLLSAASREALTEELDRLDQCAQTNAYTLRDLAFSCAVKKASQGKFRAALIATDLQQLSARIRRAKQRESGKGVSLSEGENPTKPALLFPGQGAQYVGMGGEMALYFPEYRRAFAMGDALEHPLSPLVLPPAPATEEEQQLQNAALTATETAQPAIGMISTAMLDMMLRLGIEPACTAGHSYGEFPALHAAGFFDRKALFSISAERGRLLGTANTQKGAMAVVFLSRNQLEEQLAGTDVVIANANGPKNFTLSGREEDLLKLLNQLDAQGIVTKRLRVSAAFHTQFMSPARAPFSKFLSRLPFSKPYLPVYANLDGRPYPTDLEAIRDRLVRHIETPVDFVSQIEQMYQNGIRVFLELGPGKVLTGLTGAILGDRPHRAIPSDGGMEGFLTALGELFVAGCALQPEALFDGRKVELIDFKPIPTPQSGWWMNGGRIWKDGEDTAHVGSKPLVDKETIATANLRGPINDGNMVEQSYVAYQETMRQFLTQQKEMMDRVLDHAGTLPVTKQERPPTTQEAEPQPEPESNPIASIPSGRADVLKKLIAIVSEKTGYPEDMLNPDVDFEAELGIDSIKRIEIIGQIRERTLGNALSSSGTAIEALTRVKTLNEMVEALFVGQDEQPEQTSCLRTVFQGEPQQLAINGSNRLQGLYLITEDRSGVAERLARKLEQAGAQVLVYKADDTVPPNVRGIVHLAALGEAYTDQAGLQEWRAMTGRITKSLFHLLQQANPKDRELDVLAATQFGGYWGRDQMASGSAAAGGCHGVLRTLEKEYPKIRTKVVDFDSDASSVFLADQIATELRCFEDGENELGYPAGKRLRFIPLEASLENMPARESWRLTSGDTVLVTGGAMGITKKICEAVTVPGLRLIVTGRRPRPVPQDGLPSTEEEHRKRLIEEWRKEGRTLVPAEIEFELQTQRRNAECALGLSQLEQAGAEVIYHAIDVRSEEAFGGLIADLYARFGKIDAVIHGAGVIEDCHLAEKKSDSFDRVFDTKADSTFILSQHLKPNELKWVALFSSISGRIGNPGQVDYAAANETMNRLAWQMQNRWPETRVVSVNWGPWQDIGMAAGLTDVFEQRNISPIAPADGVRFFLDELSRGSTDHVEVVAGAWQSKQ